MGIYMGAIWVVKCGGVLHIWGYIEGRVSTAECSMER